MKLIRQNFDQLHRQTPIKPASPEIPATDSDVAQIKISSRYPEKGWCRNTLCTMFCKVVSGRGRISIKNPDGSLSTAEFSNYDIIEVYPGEIYFWETLAGTLTLSITSSPPWSKEQQELIPE